jgi:hypothetical protein
VLVLVEVSLARNNQIILCPLASFNPGEDYVHEGDVRIAGLWAEFDELLDMLLRV